MKEKHIIILIICISALLRSCNTPDNIFCDTSILITKFETEISSEGKLITDTLFFANNLFAFDDKILIINGSNAQYLFQLFDNEFNVNIANFGSYGRANSEFLSNRFLNNLQNSSEGNTVLWICDHNKKAIKALDVSSSLIENKSVINMEFEIPVVMPVATFIANDSIMVCLGLLKNNLRLVNVDLNNGKLLIDTKFYKLNAIKDVQTTFIGGWSITPDGTKLVNCMSSFNQLNICKIDGTNRKSVSFEEYPKSIESALNNDDLPVYYYYVNVICDNNYIYALYCNTDYSVMDNENIDTQLHIFDHNLNPIKKVELDKNIFQITIGNTPNIIYALDYENKIWKYNI